MSRDIKKDNALSRWSKRKRAVAVEEEEAVESPADEVTQELTDAKEDELLANREAAEAIDLDTIDADSDLSLFMKEGVPEALKRKALSVLWRSNPVFANLDGLNDYDENFADPNLIMKKFTSAYQVGKGYLKEALEEDISEEENLAQQAVGDSVKEDDQADETVVETDEILDAEEEVQASDFVEEDDSFHEEPPLPKVSLRKRLNLEG